MSTSYTDRVFLAFMKCRGLDAFALKALRLASHLLGMAIGARLGEMRDNGEPFLAAASKCEEQSLLLRIAHEANEILAARWDRVPKKHRPYYTPEQRYRILRIKDLLALSCNEVAGRFRIDPRTITRWQAESAVDPESATVGSLVKPRPPVRRYADVVRGVVQTMALAGFGGDEMIAQTLARAGWRLSKRSVGRIRKEKRAGRPTPPTPKAPGVGHAVTAHYPNHVLMMDITDIPSLFRIVLFRLVVVLDVFSRMPLAARVTASEPTARVVTEVFSAAVGAHAPPPHLVTDQGGQFVADVFQETVKATGSKQRFGAIGKTGSIALIERLWRTVKGLVGSRIQPPLTLEDCRRRVELALMHYAYCRPHRSLGGATPAEAYFGIRPAHLSASPPPRGRPGDGGSQAPFEIAYLDPEGRLPLLLPQAA